MLRSSNFSCRQALIKANDSGHTGFTSETAGQHERSSKNTTVPRAAASLLASFSRTLKSFASQVLEATQAQQHPHNSLDAVTMSGPVLLERIKHKQHVSQQFTTSDKTHFNLLSELDSKRYRRRVLFADLLAIPESC